MGTGLALMLSVLVAAALLNEVIMPELLRLTMPAALLVMPAIVPEPLKFRVPVLVNLASAVLMAPKPLMVIFPALERVVTKQVPPRLSVPVALLVKVPAPDKPVVTVSVLLLEIVPVIATLGIEIKVNPPIVLEAPLKVWVPVLALKVVALFVKFPAIV